MKYIECPQVYKKQGRELSVFLAGGITNCPNWQASLVKLLKDKNVIF